MREDDIPTAMLDQMQKAALTQEEQQILDDLYSSSKPNLSQLADFILRHDAPFSGTFRLILAGMLDPTIRPPVVQLIPRKTNAWQGWIRRQQRKADIVHAVVEGLRAGKTVENAAGDAAARLKISARYAIKIWKEAERAYPDLYGRQDHFGEYLRARADAFEKKKD